MPGFVLNFLPSGGLAASLPREQAWSATVITTHKPNLSLLSEAHPPPHSLEVTVELGRQEMTSLEASYTSQPLKASHSSDIIHAKTPTSTVHHQILSSPELGQCWREIFSPPRYFSLNDCCFRVVIERSLELTEWPMLCR